MALIAPCFAASFRLFLCLALGSSINAVSSQHVNVTVPGVGEIVGKTQPVTLPDGNRSSIASFLGIPYAEPPVGDLRFAKPVPKKNITSPFLALEYKAHCPQVRRSRVVGDENCLFLNVHVPSAALHSHSGSVRTESPDGSESLLPVLVWIHGGAFVIGSGDIDAGKLAAFGEIIVVTMNYRLGPLGFLSTNDQYATGNFGLWDQRLAIIWVKNNIAAFGGNPNMITIGGGSAGSFCVTFQALYPPNQGLFQRFIAASGSALSGAQTRTNVGTYARALAQKLHCNTSTTQETVNCLRQKTKDEIVGTNIDPVVPFEAVWAPSLDHDFIPKRPDKLLSWPPSGANLSHLQSVDAMFMTTAAEGIVSFELFVSPLASRLGLNLKQGVPKQLYDQVIDDVILSLKAPTSTGSKDSAVVATTDSSGPQNPETMTTTGPGEPPHQAVVVATSSSRPNNSDTADSTESSDTINPAVVNAIDYEYRNWQDPSNPATLAQSTVDLLTDRQWFVPNVIFCRNHAANNSRTRAYLLQFDLPKEYSGGQAWLTGAGHVGYSSYTWGTLGTLNLSTEGDRKRWNLSKALMTYWTNFIKTGRTNSATPVQVQWLPFTVQDENCLDVNFDVISSRKHCKARRTEFWLDYMPKVNSHAGNGDPVNVKTDCVSSGSPKLLESVLVIVIGAAMFMA